METTRLCNERESDDNSSMAATEADTDAHQTLKRLVDAKGAMEGSRRVEELHEGAQVAHEPTEQKPQRGPLAAKLALQRFVEQQFKAYKAFQKWLEELSMGTFCMMYFGPGSRKDWAPALDRGGYLRMKVHELEKRMRGNAPGWAAALQSAVTALEDERERDAALGPVDRGRRTGTEQSPEVREDAPRLASQPPPYEAVARSKRSASTEGRGSATKRMAVEGVKDARQSLAQPDFDFDGGDDSSRSDLFCP
ncbi:hypothetical protein LTR65_000291 [Meristemomyces frigidus]